MIFFTSDTHFSHANIIKFCKRPFKYVKEMDETIISRWNSVVDPKDTVYHLGDFALASPDYTASILKRLNGNIYLCIGSHEKSALHPRCCGYFHDINKTFEIKIKGQTIFLSHYCHKIWPKSHYGAWHLFAHSHGGMNVYAASEGKLLDVGVDSHDFTPLSSDQVDDIMNERPLNFNDLTRRS